MREVTLTLMSGSVSQKKCVKLIDRWQHNFEVPHYDGTCFDAIFVGLINIFIAKGGLHCTLNGPKAKIRVF